MCLQHHSCFIVLESMIQLQAAYCKTNTEIDRWAVLCFTPCTQGQEIVKLYPLVKGRMYVSANRVLLSWLNKKKRTVHNAVIALRYLNASCRWGNFMWLIVFIIRWPTHLNLERQLYIMLRYFSRVASSTQSKYFCLLEYIRTGYT